MEKSPHAGWPKLSKPVLLLPRSLQQHRVFDNKHWSLRKTRWLLTQPQIRQGHIGKPLHEGFKRTTETNNPRGTLMYESYDHLHVASIKGDVPPPISSSDQLATQVLYMSLKPVV